MRLPPLLQERIIGHHRRVEEANVQPRHLGDIVGEQGPGDFLRKAADMENVHSHGREEPRQKAGMENEHGHDHPLRTGDMVQEPSHDRGRLRRLTA